MKQIVFSGSKYPDKFALCDDDEYDFLMQHVWYCHHDKKSDNYYATAQIDKKIISMHRMIMCAAKGQRVDHKNGDGLDNQKSNLRFATRRQNGFNRRSARGSSSKYLGVSRSPNSISPWQVMVCSEDGQRVRIGSFADEEEAARARDKAARILQGEFARLNFPEEEQFWTRQERTVLPIAPKTKRAKSLAKRRLKRRAVMRFGLPLSDMLVMQKEAESRGVLVQDVLRDMVSSWVNSRP